VLGIIAFASIEGSSPYEAWPLNEAINTEPEWLKMCIGKTTLWPLVQPDRPDSIFRPMYSGKSTWIKFPSSTASAIEQMQPAFIELFELDEFTMDSDPYLFPAICISTILDMDCTELMASVFYSFSNYIQNDFAMLVRNKDARALLLMAYWYSKICTGQWWMRRRALLEGQATCLYLVRYHAEDRTIQDLLRAPMDKLFRYEKGDLNRDIFCFHEDGQPISRR
jgi:hypothetical protein